MYVNIHCRFIGCVDSVLIVYQSSRCNTRVCISYCIRIRIPLSHVNGRRFIDSDTYNKKYTIDYIDYVTYNCVHVENYVYTLRAYTWTQFTHIQYTYPIRAFDGVIIYTRSDVDGIFIYTRSDVDGIFIYTWSDFDGIFIYTWSDFDGIIISTSSDFDDITWSDLDGIIIYTWSDLDGIIIYTRIDFDAYIGYGK